MQRRSFLAGLGMLALTGGLTTLLPGCGETAVTITNPNGAVTYTPKKSRPKKKKCGENEKLIWNEPDNKWDCVEKID